MKIVECLFHCQLQKLLFWIRCTGKYCCCFLKSGRRLTHSYRITACLFFSDFCCLLPRLAITATFWIIIYANLYSDYVTHGLTLCLDLTARESLGDPLIQGVYMIMVEKNTKSGISQHRLWFLFCHPTFVLVTSLTCPTQFTEIIRNKFGKSSLRTLYNSR